MLDTISVIVYLVDMDKLLENKNLNIVWDLV